MQSATAPQTVEPGGAIEATNMIVNALKLASGRKNHLKLLRKFAELLN
jgi:hypothetical protein